MLSEHLQKRVFFFAEGAEAELGKKFYRAGDAQNLEDFPFLGAVETPSDELLGNALAAKFRKHHQAPHLGDPARVYFERTAGDDFAVRHGNKKFADFGKLYLHDGLRIKPDKFQYLGPVFFYCLPDSDHLIW